MDYKNTTLWTNAFENVKTYNLVFSERLKNEYEKARKNTTLIVDKIRVDFPQLTIHDITHIDALWQTGSVIVGADFKLNPLEGFVLGCSFLFHDAVMSYEAAGGQTMLRNTEVWKDYYADCKNNMCLSEEEEIKEADFQTIRFLHAEKAKELYNKLFYKDDGSSFYVIEDESLRTHLGEIIGTIAASHHWNLEEIEHLDSQQPPMAGYPNDWNINPIKLACILRCADAAHLDSGRAPDHLLKLLDINGVSRAHWMAQNRLSQIAVDLDDPEVAVIKSEISFSEEEFSAWNVAFDAITVLNNEIKGSNECLKNHGMQEFQIKRIKGADSQERLAEQIKTTGWKPCNACIHISDVENLIRNLGGEKLYGKDHHFEIALRELIQNSRDAIAARRFREPGFDGRISISICHENDHTIVTVSDNGVGMSLQTIKECFLNFGNSFWSSSLAKKEYPGLYSSAFKSVGRFGIGFYAVFMAASKVVVETRKYDSGLDDTYTIKFPKGLCLRPIISKTRSATTSVSTKVQLYIDDEKCPWRGMMTIKPSFVGAESFEVPYSAVLANLTAGLDVDVYYAENNSTASLIHSNILNIKIGTPAIADWLKDITFARYQKDSVQCEYIDRNYKRLREITYNGEFRGIAALNNLWDSRITCFDVLTVGGLSNLCYGSYDAEYLGCLLSNPITAKRDADLKEVDLSDWAREQYEMLLAQGLSDQDKLFLPYSLGKYGIDMSDRMIVRVFFGKRLVFISLSDLISIIKMMKLILPISLVGDEKKIENHLNYEASLSMLRTDELLFVPERNSGFLDMSHNQAFPYNLWACLEKTAERCHVKLHISKEGKRLQSVLGACDVFIVTASGQ